MGRQEGAASEGGGRRAGNPGAGPTVRSEPGPRSDSERKPLQVSSASGAVVESAGWSRVGGSVNVPEVTPGLRVECGPVCWTMDQALRPPATEG